MDNRPPPVKRAGTQHSRADLAKMSPEEIVKAQKEGRLVDVLSGKKKHPATTA